ncbi:rRNA maturation RNase YbeY [Rickettsiales endosymbiont of Stachyamoeba lipophora]|uniref:rRNA maturation RNase YbeY n=1 Tax=Rickettsiales endosymbiont of Stachyamoeba lipophora TaxID=2486578 RepID=UPI000F6456CD|nr:rRNA maturation RNase YbeY [Rickettsiales endosymbiont of Stachyamoeba lipophora]AZL15566.1 rRNA maturation RNase YbeY [Rickettsiales endosymbiont of Stachyamoeba lipophora]
MPKFNIYPYFEFQEAKWHKFKGVKAYTGFIITDTLNYVSNDLISQAKEIELSIILTNDEYIRPLKKEYLGLDQATNVLSFPSLEFQEGKLISQHEVTEGHAYLGEIIVSFNTLERESKEQNKSFNYHYTHLIIHSVLHLLGFDHINNDEAARMEELEEQLLRKLLNEYHE